MKSESPAAIPGRVERQHAFFRSGATRDTGFRAEQLTVLKNLLIQNEERFFDALEKDFQKPPFETYGTELGQVYEEIDLAVKKIPKWSRPEKVSGSLVNFPSRNYVYPQPYGVTLVMGTWNYPILLTLHPVVSAIAAGNTVVLKPSELSFHTAHLLNDLISSAFDPGLFTVIEGDAETAQLLLDQPFDYIFFSGSTRVGRLVMEAAARQLTPVTLELGGKCPAIVDGTADLETAARRIAWGKFINAGQTCVAPDYLAAETACKDKLISLISKAISDFYGGDPSRSPDYPRIINEEHFRRLTDFLDNGIVAAGGTTDPAGLYIAPTVLDNISWDDPVMQEEIFGPVLPVVTFDRYEELMQAINDRPTPLSLYLFTSDTDVERNIIETVEFGGGCINDTVTHLGNPNLPFGGKGSSGLGSYHGKTGFDTFTHSKSILKKPTWPDLPLRYPPYEGKLKWIKKILN